MKKKKQIQRRKLHTYYSKAASYLMNCGIQVHTKICLQSKILPEEKQKFHSPNYSTNITFTGKKGKGRSYVSQFRHQSQQSTKTPLKDNFEKEL